MRRGRKPLPPELKALKGERADRMPAAAAPPSEPPECPAYLDDVAREEWGRMVAILGQNGGLTPLSGQSLAVYCDAFSRLQMARLDIAAHGVAIFTDQGSLKTNPAVNVAKDAQGIMLRVLADFSKAAAPNAAPEADELTEFLTK